KPFVDNENDLENYNKITVQNFIQNEMMKQTRLQVSPVDEFERTIFTFPGTLRLVIEYLALIHSFEDYQKENDLVMKKNRKNAIKILRDNVKNYKYFCLSKFQDYLPFEKVSVINEWISLDYAFRNSFICKQLIDLVALEIKDEKKRETFRDSVKFVKKESYNVSMSDVFEATEIYK